MTTLNDLIINISTTKIALDRIIECCPFDSQKNLNKNLTPELFFNEEIGLYFETDDIKSLRSNIKNGLFHGAQNKRILFLYGYSGIGKSTFLRKLINEINDNDLPVIIDFQEIVSQIRSVNDLDNIIHKSNPIAVALQQFLFKQQEDIQKDYFKFIKVNKKYLISSLRNFFHEHDILKDKPEYSDNLDLWHELLLSSTFNDSLILFFIFLLKQFDANYHKDKKCIVIFDNLDSIDLNYFSDDFQALFPNILDVITLLSQDENIFINRIDFVAKYKFIFCIREANNFQINSNNSDRIWNHKIEYKLEFDQINYEGAFIKRLNFIKLIYSEEEIYDLLNISMDEIIMTTESLFKSLIFSNTYLPLFNNDFRKLSSSLFEIMVSMGSELKYLISDNYLFRYKAVSHILFSLIKRLSTNNYIVSFHRPSPSIDDATGYCHPARMVLTYIINYSNNRINNGYYAGNSKGDISLFDLISFFDNKYSPETIINVLSGLFKYHSDGWIHPITIKNKLVKDRESFKRELKLINKYTELTKIEINSPPLDDNQDKEMTMIKRQLDNIKIKSNPAGFAFLRYIVSSYNYYLIINNKTQSLLDYDIKLVLASGSEFDKVLNVVFENVSRHIVLMNKFLRAKYIKKDYNIEDYKLSNYSWKYVGEGIAQPRGILHTTRILDSHIGHLDTCRNYFIEITDNFDNKALINKKFITIIDKYNNLFKSSEDFDEHSHFHQFKSAIDRIKISNYKDFISEIKLS